MILGLILGVKEVEVLKLLDESGFLFLSFCANSAKTSLELREVALERLIYEEIATLIGSLKKRHCLTSIPPSFFKQKNLESLIFFFVHAGAIDHVRVHPKFLHSNATSHRWVLGGKFHSIRLLYVLRGIQFARVVVCKYSLDSC